MKKREKCGKWRSQVHNHDSQWSLYSEVTVLCLTYDGHDDVDIGALDVGHERQHVVENDHLVETVQQTIYALQCVQPRLYAESVYCMIHDHEAIRTILAIDELIQNPAISGVSF